jgi:hypothetical protein
LATNLKTFIDGLHDPKSLDINNQKSPMLKLITNSKWKEIKEKILDKTKDHLLDKTIEYAETAAPLAFVTLSTIFIK